MLFFVGADDGCDGGAWRGGYRCGDLVEVADGDTAADAAAGRTGGEVVANRTRRKVTGVDEAADVTFDDAALRPARGGGT